MFVLNERKTVINYVDLFYITIGYFVNRDDKLNQSFLKTIINHSTWAFAIMLTMIYHNYKIGNVNAGIIGAACQLR